MQNNEQSPELNSGNRLAGVLAAASLGDLVPPGVRNAAHAGERTGPEKPEVTFGIIPLTDCAPIVVAHELGYFEKHGLRSTVSREASWANIRDKLAAGALAGRAFPLFPEVRAGRSVGGARQRGRPARVHSAETDCLTNDG